MAKKKKKRRKSNSFNPSIENCHHLLWQARHWNVGYGKALRNHPYMKKMMPRDTLHKEIHSRIADIPMPSGELCKKALIEINYRMKEGLISIEHDSAEKRIDLLLDVWDFDSCPRTILMLKWQKDIIASFYHKGGS